jgi:hypothetical protein
MLLLSFSYLLLFSAFYLLTTDSVVVSWYSHDEKNTPNERAY